MAETSSQGRPFFCREWAWAKLWACVEQRPSAKTCGVLIVGGPGTGKTSLCSQLVSPTGSQGRHVKALRSRILAHHFCHSHDSSSLSVASFIQRLVVQLAESPFLPEYSSKVAVEDVVSALDPVTIQKDPDEALRRAVLFPLLELDPPEKTLLLVIDSVDETHLQTWGGISSQRDLTAGDDTHHSQSPSKTIVDLLASHHHLLPQWLLIVITSRRGSRTIMKQFAGFRKIALDDLRRSHVVRDVQQYILCRLDNEPALRHHLSRETAEMLNQLHIKSNGCFLYLERVLDGVVEGWVTLREIRDIPGTLNGLYLWLCQRLYPRRQYQRVTPLLAVALAARTPLTQIEMREAVSTHVTDIDDDEWNKRWELLKRVICPYSDEFVLLFHHSFAEWLLDVKHCTQKYLVDGSQGHIMLAMRYTRNAPQLEPSQLQDFVFHLARVPLKPHLESFHLALWLLYSGADLTECFNEVTLRDQLSIKILHEAGVTLSEDQISIEDEDDDDDDDDYEEENEIERKPDVKYTKLKEEETKEELKENAENEDGTNTEIANKELDENDDKAKKIEQNNNKNVNNIEITELLKITLDDKENIEIELTTKASESDHPCQEIQTSPCGDPQVALEKQDNGEDKPDGPTLSSEGPKIGDSKSVSNEGPQMGGPNSVSNEGPQMGGPDSVSNEGPQLSVSNPAEMSSSGGSKQRERRRRRHREDPLYPYLRGGPVDQIDAAGRTLLHTAAHQGDSSLVRVLLERGASHSISDRGGQTPLNLSARHGHAEVVATLMLYGASADHADDDGWTALRSAAWAGHYTVVGALLSGGAHVDLADGDGRTALRAAAWGGHEEVVMALLQNGAGVNQADAEGRTPLIAAAYMGHSEIVEALLVGGADVNHSDVDGRAALSVAALCVPASEGHLQVVTALLERGASVDHQDRDGLTPLVVAAFEGHVDVCELLLEYEADVDHVDRSGRTPLLAAASMGHAAVVERLLFWGCYVDHIDVEGRTVLSVAAAQGSQDSVRLLLDRGLDETHRDNAGWTPLHYASFEGHKNVCEALIEAGARINEVDNDGKHALVLAAQEGHAAVVASLLDAGASIHHTSHDGRSALRVAALEGHKEVVHLLLCRGADLHYKDADGRSTLYLLALENRLEMAQFLLERGGADVESTDLEGRTPLHVTAWQGHAGTVELLLAHSARVDAVDLEQRTPLQSAAWQGNADIVRILLEHGAVVDHTCSQGATALSIASQEGHHDCVALLLQFGANPGHSDRCGRTAIKVALKGGHHHLARLLEDHLDQQKQQCQGATNARHHGVPSKIPTGVSASSLGSGSTGETKPCSALLCPGLTSSPVESPESTFEKRRSCASLGQHSSSKSSGNLTSSTRSSGGVRAATPRDNIPFQMLHQQQRPPPAPAPPAASVMSPVLSFTQQLQQCRRGRGRRTKPLPQPALTPLDEPASPIYASPPQSPVDDVPPAVPPRVNPMAAMLEEEYSLPVGQPGARPLPPTPAFKQEPLNRTTGSYCGPHSSATAAAVAGGIVGVGGGISTSTASPTVGSVGGGTPASGFTFTQDQHMRIILGIRSPSESRPKRNGIVTNPSLKAAQAKAAHILRNGLSAGRQRQTPARPNGLSIKKETPL